ncbi:hypothetical protein GCM10025880_29610 [Methylorubrum aminovorans]|uniref:SDR family NAD(P)-dependent oxidoreductase n=1 Tax=Methylorubrum aminovorans TaxID=269069 RepID=UPI0023E9E219|nr:hypothetical protein GCM10025880_29610 [Methylorubrum aminovorans]
MRRRALIVGASRGLGLGLVARFLARGWDVTATVRRPSQALADLSMDAPLRIEAGVDIDDDGAVADLRTRLAEVPDFDLVFVVAGIATQAGTPASLLSREVVGAVFQTNAVSPIRFAEAFHRRVAPGGLIVLMTSKLGSVSLNRGGGWSSYRASKAALNTLARSFAGQHKGADWGSCSCIRAGCARISADGAPPLTSRRARVAWSACWRHISASAAASTSTMPGRRCPGERMRRCGARTGSAAASAPANPNDTRRLTAHERIRPDRSLRRHRRGDRRPPP